MGVFDLIPYEPKAPQSSQEHAVGSIRTPRRRKPKIKIKVESPRGNPPRATNAPDIIYNRNTGLYELPAAKPQPPKPRPPEPWWVRASREEERQAKARKFWDVGSTRDARPLYDKSRRDQERKRQEKEAERQENIAKYGHSSSFRIAEVKRHRRQMAEANAILKKERENKRIAKAKRIARWGTFKIKKKKQTKILSRRMRIGL